MFAARTSELITYHQIPLKPKLPREGWVEQDPRELLSAVRECIARTVDNLRNLDIDPSDIVATGVANQRETTVVWDATTGEPLYNTIGIHNHFIVCFTTYITYNFVFTYQLITMNELSKFYFIFHININIIHTKLHIYVYILITL